MIKIRMKTLASGPEFVRPVGWEGEVEDKEARALIAGDFAEAVMPPASTAIKPPVEKATKPQGEKRVKK